MSILCPPTSLARDEFYQAFPHVIVLQATIAGVRRPGNKATCKCGLAGLKLGCIGCSAMVRAGLYGHLTLQH